MKTLAPVLLCLHSLLLSISLYAQQPANDNCANAAVIQIPGGGFAYGTFVSDTSDMTNATAEPGEYFATPNYVKSVWFEFTLPVHRSINAQIIVLSGDSVTCTLYLPSGCLPGPGAVSATFIGESGGKIENPCSEYGTYRIQVTGLAGLATSVFINLTLDCPAKPMTSKYDCPADAFVFNNGNPLPQNSSTSTGNHEIGCQSVDDSTEYGCLPLPDKDNYLQSTWYVFTTGNLVDLVSFNCTVSPSGSEVGYRLFQGDVRPAGPAGLPEIDCGLARKSFSSRYIEFPCMPEPNTTYSLVLFFHRDFNNNGNNFSLTARQRGQTPTGWPLPVLPPVLAGNQIGTLPDGQSIWTDRFDCSARIILNPCPPANPDTGTVTIGTGNNAKTFDLATWATFTLSNDAHVNFQYQGANYSPGFHTRIFNTLPGTGCPSPDPETDLVYEFPGSNGAVLCLPAGDYAIQVLSSSSHPSPNPSNYQSAWSSGNLGEDFNLRLTIEYLPADGLFRLHEAGAFDSVNGFSPLQDGVLYGSTPAVFVCDKTVLPANTSCPDVDRALYREIVLDADGLLCLRNLRTDDWPDPPVVYQFFQGDANALAISQNVYNAGQMITGLTDYAGICIDADDNSFTPPGLDSFCICATAATYTLVSLGDSTNVGLGDAPGAQHRVLQTIHNTRANAETIALANGFGAYLSAADVFSCADNLGNMPPCGDRKKLIFREFYLQDTAVVTVVDIGSSSALISVFSGQASDPASTLVSLSGGCQGVDTLIDECTPLLPGWYTVVSYGEGPNYTDRHIWDKYGNPRDVGKTSRLLITLDPVRTPRYNRPHKAFQAGITDWTPAPGNTPNVMTAELYPLGTEYFCPLDTPFISDSIVPCTPDYNRVAFYVFTITQPSFVQIRDVPSSFYVEVFPFDVSATPGALMSVDPVYQCMATHPDYRQICDLPPGDYTLVIFANDTHQGDSVKPVLYVEKVGLSRFDDISQSYDFDVVPGDDTWRNGRVGDQHPLYLNEPPSRDVIYCTTGARITDPEDTRCGTQLNPLIYAPGPKPLFLPGNPPPPGAQPWRNVWYTFVATGSGEGQVRINALTSGTKRPMAALYRSPLNGSLPWSSLELLGDAALSAGLILEDDNIFTFSCNASSQVLRFYPNGCMQDSTRYFVVLSFDADDPNFPNQAVSVDLRYKQYPTFAPLYDEQVTANVVNGLGEIQPPYTNVPLTPGSTFTGPPFSLLCYTANPTDPPDFACGADEGQSAWFTFEVQTAGQLYTALQEVNGTGWYNNNTDVSVWQAVPPNDSLVELPLEFEYDQHAWLSGCIGPGTYYLLVRACSVIDPLEPYQPVIKLTESPGDFCHNAIDLNVPGFSTPVSASATVDCHTIGTDYGETTAAGMGCMPGPAGYKTSWFEVQVTAGPKMDIRFSLSENLSGGVSLNSLSYRVLSGTCGALTPVLCSTIGSNVITQNCLGPGTYYVQVTVPELDDHNDAVTGTVTVTVEAIPNNDPNCNPSNPNAPVAIFSYTADCQTVFFTNNSTAGTDISYAWVFSDNTTSTEAAPTWSPAGPGPYNATLTVTNTANGLTAGTSAMIVLNNPFANYQPMPDTILCNGASVLLDATVPGAMAYVWNDGSTTSSLSVDTPGLYSVTITQNGCEQSDTVVVSAVNAQQTIDTTLCPGDSLVIGGQVFNAAHPNDTVLLPAGPSGCDSILTVALSFFPEESLSLDTTLCEGLSFIVGNETFSAGNPSGQVVLPGADPNGCPLTVLVEAHFIPPVSTIIRDTLCAGEIFAYGGEVYTEAQPSGMVVLPAAIAGDCDTMVTIDLTFYHPDTALLAVQRCANDTFAYGGSIFTIQQPQGFVLLPDSARYGCDSVVQVQVTFVPTVQDTLLQTLCAGDSISLYGIVFSESHPTDLIPVPGSGPDCDTALYISVSFLPESKTSLNGTLCPGEQLQVGAEVFDANRLSGVVTLTSQNGCDSIITVDLTALPPATDTISGLYCPFDTVVLFGKIFTAAYPADTVIREHVAPNGCDSIWTIDLTFKTFESSQADLTACQGGTTDLQAPPGGGGYIWQDSSTQPVFTATQTGTYWVETLDPAGCTIRRDSFTVVFDVLEAPQAAPGSTCANTSAQLTAGGSSGNYRWYDSPAGGTPLFTGPVFNTGPLNMATTFWVEAFLSADCISPRIPVPVTIYQVESSAIAASICETESYPFGGQDLNLPGVYTDTLPTVHGCDSVITLTLTVNDTFFQKSSVNICHDGTYTLPNGQLVDQAGIYTVPLTTQHGCDSTWEITVLQNQLFLLTDSVSICAGGTYSLPWGGVADQSGTYSQSLPYVDLPGCDSLVWIVVVQETDVIQPMVVVQSDFNGFALSCHDSSDGEAATMPSGGVPPYSFVWSNGGTQAGQAGLSAGIYTVTITDTQACTATGSVTLVAPPELTLLTDVVSPLCPGDQTGTILASAGGGTGPYLYALGNGVLGSSPVFENLQPGAYPVTVEDTYGCSATVTADIDAPASLSLAFDPAEYTLHLGDSIQLQPVLDFFPDSVAWMPAMAGLSCLDCLQPWAKPVESTEYELTVWTADGCLAYATIQIRVDGDIRIYVPTAFSPNLDGQNDYFTVYTGSEVAVIRSLQVFDRWGDAVFEARDFLPGSDTGQWDGTARGQALNPGVFTWVCKVELSNGNTQELSGDVTLIR